MTKDRQKGAYLNIGMMYLTVSVSLITVEAEAKSCQKSKECKGHNERLVVLPSLHIGICRISDHALPETQPFEQLVVGLLTRAAVYQVGIRNLHML
jgi:hypothetical protein